jgi:hypothetical protein
VTTPDPARPQRPRPFPAVSSRVLTWWFGLMSIAGVGFGVFAENRPFGDNVLAHPLVVLFTIVGAVLLVLRVMLARPVPEIIPERLLVVGCLVGVAAFLIGNWLATHLVAMR